MELSLLVYAISLLPKLDSVTSGAMFFLALGLFCTTFFVGMLTDGGFNDIWKNLRPFVLWIVPLFMICGIINTLLPSEKTAYTMVGAYAAQKIALDPRTQEVGGKVMTLINQKLDYYVQQSTNDLNKLKH